MLSVGAMGSSGGYYLNLAREDYYLEGGEPLGRWWGKGAKEIVGSTIVTKDALRALLQGYSPRGEALVQNAGKENRQPGWDLTFSPPKSVSVLWSQADEKTRHAIQAAHFEAVKAALRYLEEEAAYTRRGKAGDMWEKAGLVVATFEHGTSRAQDPQPHTHALVLNVGLREDGTTGTILSKVLYQHKMAAGALYRAELATQLSEGLGVCCERQERGKAFSLSGVPQALCDEFSKRRAEVEARLLSRGAESAAAAAMATLETRRTKQDVPPRSELFAQWRIVGEAFGFQASQVLGQEVKATNEQKEFRSALLDSLKEITESESHFTEKQLLQHVAVNSQDRNLSADFIRRQVKDALRQSHEIVALGAGIGEPRYTTQEVLKAERELIASADRLRANEKHGASAADVEWAIVHAERKLTDEQKDAVRHLAELGGGLRSLEGLAGTGKTSALAVAREAWEKAGYQVIGATLSAKAEKELEKAAQIDSHTIASLERKLAAGDADTNRPDLREVLQNEAKQLGRALLGKERNDRPISPVERIDSDSLADVLKHEAKQAGRALLGKDRDDRALRPEKPIERHDPADVLKHEAKQMGRALIGKERDDRAVGSEAIDRQNPVDVLKHEVKQFGRRLLGEGRDDRALKHGQKKGREAVSKPVAFDDKTVLVIDEAGMVATKELAKLVSAVEKAGGMVVNVFDRKQLQAIGPGGGAAFLADRHGKATLSEIVRQHEEWAKDAMRQFQRGDGAGALKQFEAAGRLHVAENREKAMTALVSDWSGKEKGRREGALVFVGTREEVKVVNERCQAARLKSGELSGRSLQHGEQQYYRGDRVLFTENSKRIGVENGTLGTIINLHPARAIATVKLDAGNSVHVPLKAYQEMELGYAVTTHKGQGTTVDRAYVLAGGKMQDMHAAYVQGSRARESTHLYTDRHEAGDRLSQLAQQMSKENQKTLAHEMAQRAREEERERQSIRQRQGMRI